MRGLSLVSYVQQVTELFPHVYLQLFSDMLPWNWPICHRQLFPEVWTNMAKNSSDRILIQWMKTQKYNPNLVRKNGQNAEMDLNKLKTRLSEKTEKLEN